MMFKVKKMPKNYFECARRNKYKQKALIYKKSVELSEYCQTFGLKLNEIKLCPNDEDPFTSSTTKITVIPNEIPDERVSFNHLIAKDLAQLSNRHYCLQRTALLETQKMPGIKKILKLQYKLNEFFEIYSNNYGYYCSPEQKIKYVCEKFLLRKPNFSNSRFNIKLSIDSTTISSKHLILLNVSFNLMDDDEFCKSVNGTFILGSFEINKEDYDNVKKSLNELLHPLENVKSIKIKGEIYQISFYLGCDYKMIRILFGQQAPNAIKGCFWCRALMNQVGPTLQHHLDPITKDYWKISRKLTDEPVFREPIIKFIDFHMVLIDDLHLMMRFSDKLYKLLLLKFIRLDKNEGKDLTLRKNLQIFIRFLEDKCKIQNPYYIAEKPGYGKIQFRSFNGNERMRIFSELYEPKIDKETKEEINPAKRLNGLFANGIDPPYDFKKEDSVWLGFYSLYQTFKNYNKDITTILSIKESLKELLNDYLFISKKENNSEKLFVYLHCLIFHYSEMLEIHGSIHSFSTQPNEKLNDFFTQYYHKSTNKHYLNKNYLIQMIKKRNRIEFYNLKGKLEEFYDSNIGDVVNDSDEASEDENVDDTEDE